MQNNLALIYFKDALVFLKGLGASNTSNKIEAALEKLSVGDFTSVNTKKLRGSVRELIVDECRLLFFIRGNVIYVMDGFIKKAQKTPRRILERAERIIKSML